MTMTVRWLVGTAALLVLIQAALIGQFLNFGDASRLALHGWLGSGSFAAAVILTVLTLLAVRRGDVIGPAVGIGILVTLLMVAQLGLGYAGRRGGWPAAIHIPNGVLIADLLFALVALTFWPASQTNRIRS